MGDVLKDATVMTNIPATINVLHYSDWVCTAVVSNDVMNDLRG